MNFILSYLQKKWSNLGLEHFGPAEELSSLILTPGFKASGHLVIFIFNENPGEPILVIKLPRLLGNHERLDREALNLQKVRTILNGEFNSIPDVISYEDFMKQRLLVETVVQGQIMRQSLVRQNPEICLRAGLDWLENFHSLTINEKEKTWYNEFVEPPMRYLKDNVGLTLKKEQLITQTQMWVEPLRERNFPLVFEHGDFSAPNLLIDQNYQLGVVDWELAEQQGVPASDLFFFITYIAFARARAIINKQYLKAFYQAFFKPDSWAKSYILQYVNKINLSVDLLKHLFVLTWSRYVANIIYRLNRMNTNDQFLSGLNLDWLRKNRYFQLWKFTLDHINEFVIGSD